jgi:hypothetical protein
MADFLQHQDTVKRFNCFLWNKSVFNISLPMKSAENSINWVASIMHKTASMREPHHNGIINNREGGIHLPNISKMRLSKESILLIGIGSLDLTSTLIWVQNHGAQEANPLFQHYMEMGPIWFAAMKIVMLAAPIFLLEWARRRRPNFTRYASRFAACAYLLMYIVGVSKLNPQFFQPKPQQMALALYNGIDLGKSEQVADESVRDYRAGTAQQYNDPAVLGEGLH